MREAQRQAWARIEKEMTTGLNTDADARGGDKNIRKRGFCKGFTLTNEAASPANLWGNTGSPPFPGKRHKAQRV